MKYEERITAVVILPEDKPLFDPHATHIKLDDESAGEFIILEQSSEDVSGEIRIDIDEWPAIRGAINRMAKRAKKTNPK